MVFKIVIFNKIIKIKFIEIKINIKNDLLKKIKKWK
jgi:hypothetical protein